MTKSRKQKQKKKDFLKKKLKVGKTAARASNLTDTSFVAKTISVKNQHLDHNHHDLSKRFPLLKHHNATVRKETLSIFIKAIPAIIKSRLMTPLLSQAIPLICDDTKDVRDSLIELLDTIGGLDPQVLVLHCNMFVLYINMAMTHIVPRIQADSTRFLLCLLNHCGDEIVRKAWLKLMRGVMNVLGWSAVGANTSSGALQTKKRDSKATKIHLDTLGKLVEYGCFDPKSTESDANDIAGGSTINQNNKFLLPNLPQPFEHLKLFERQLKQSNSTNDSTNSTDASPGSTGTTNSLANQDLESRQAIFETDFQNEITKQAQLIVKDGGECGKAANTLNRLALAVCQA
ncbi:pre-rRNA-processing protein Ipi1p [Monosporozyma servazzii]